jgi:Dullard-like phosphatase family protein
MKSKPKPSNNTTKIKSSNPNPKNQINNNNKKSQNSKEVTSQKNKVKQTQKRNSGLKETKTYLEKSISNYETNHKNNNINNLKKTQGERIQSNKEIETTRENDLHQKIYKKICEAQKEKIKKRTNSAYAKKNQNKIKTNKVTEDQKKRVLIYINEKDLTYLENNSDNGLGVFLNILNVQIQIENEIINIMDDIKNITDRKNIYKNLFEYLNNFFEQFNSFTRNEINFFAKNELNKLTQKTLILLLIYYSILFVNTVLLSINDSIVLIRMQYKAQFKTISMIIYNIFYFFIYEDIKDSNSFKSNFSDVIENQLNKLNEKNKYKLNINSKNTDKVNEIISICNNKINICLSELKEITEAMRFSPIPPVANSIKSLLNLLNKKNILSIIDIINNVILYSLLNKNIEIAYKNMLYDKNNELDICYSRNSVPYLPKISKDRTYTLILDLDETLIHYFYSKVPIKDESHYGYFSSDDEYGQFNNYLISNENERERIDENNNDSLKIGMFLLRPYTKKFLQELNEYYEIAIFTTGTKEYCDRVLQLLDLNNDLIKYRLYKHHIALKDANISVKDLSLLGRDLSKTIIVDNLDGNFRLQPNNGLPIITWKGDINDYSLKYLATILKNIVINKVPDVRKIIKKIKTQIKSEKNPIYSKVNLSEIF